MNICLFGFRSAMPWGDLWQATHAGSSGETRCCEGRSSQGELLCAFRCKPQECKGGKSVSVAASYSVCLRPQIASQDSQGC